MGRAAQAALPALRAALKDSAPDVRDVAATALRPVQIALDEIDGAAVELVRGQAVVRDKLGKNSPRDPVRNAPSKVVAGQFRQGATYVIQLDNGSFNAYLPVSLTALWSHFGAQVAELATEVATVLAPGFRQTVYRATSLPAG